MFGFKIISEERYNQLLMKESRYDGLVNYSYWFSGFGNVYKLLRNFANGSINSTNIWEQREEFARAMGTDAYGKPIEASAFLEGER